MNFGLVFRKLKLKRNVLSIKMEISSELVRNQKMVL